MAKVKSLVKSRLILEKNGKILLLLQRKSNGGAYTLVGGNLEPGETAKETLVRESWEEAGLKINKSDLVFVHALHKVKGGENRVILFFQALHWSGNIRAKETDKFKSLEWFPINKLPGRIKPSVKIVLNRHYAGASYTEIDK